MLKNLFCQQHKTGVIKGCTKMECNKNVFLCDHCVSEHHNDETVDIDNFSLIMGANLKDTFIKQKQDWIKFCSDEQNKLQLLFKKNKIEEFIANKINAFSIEIQSKRDDYIQKFTEILKKKLQEIELKQVEMFAKSAYIQKQQLNMIAQTYERTFKYATDFYQFQSPLVLENKIMSQDDPEEYMKQIKQLKKIDLDDLMKCIKAFDEIQCKSVIDFEELFCKIEILKNLAGKNFKTNLIESSCEALNEDGQSAKPIPLVPQFKAQQGNPGQRDKELIREVTTNKKQSFIVNDNKTNNYQQEIIIQRQDQNKMNNNIPKQISIVQQNIRYEEIKPSLLKGQGVKFMIFLQADLIIYGTDTNLFSLKNKQLQQQIPLQISYISQLEKLDNNSFIIGGFKKQGEGIIFKYYKTQYDQFQSLIIQQVQGDILTMIGLNKDSTAFITSEKINNREIKYSLNYSKYLGMPNQFSFKQDLGQAKKKKIKIYTISDNQLCLHLINEYISLIQINEQKKIFEQIVRIECNMSGSVIPLINDQFLFSICVGEDKIETIIIDLKDNVKQLTGEYVWQTKSNIFDNVIAVLQITEKGKLFLALIDIYELPLAIQHFKYLGQLDIQLEQSSNYNLLIHFIEDQLYIKDEKTNAIQIYKIHIKQ